MRVDESGHDGGLAEIEHLRTIGNLYPIGGAHVRDSVSLYQHHLVREKRRGLTVEHSSGAYRNDRLRFLRVKR